MSIQTLFYENIHIIIFSLLFILFCIFIWKFVIPFNNIRKKLNESIKNLEDQEQPQINIDSTISSSDDILGKLWEKYKKSLHKESKQTKKYSHNQQVFYSTAPAEAYFTTDIIVDTPLNTDFFKHLPGILTGLGIIGTFVGILKGLKSFKVSENTAVVQESLTNLLHGVSDAFLMSASAIALAMIITFFEKMFFTILNKKVEILNSEINRIFQVIVAEDYLQTMVESSKDTKDYLKEILDSSKQIQESTTESQTHLAHLKDTFITDLKPILLEISEQQSASFQRILQQENKNLSDNIKNSLNQELSEPLNRISNTFDNTQNNQGAAVKDMLVSVVNELTHQISNVFGDQIATINSTQQQIITALQETTETVKSMASSMAEIGQEGSKNMKDNFMQAILASEARQNLVNQKLSDFLEKMNTNISGNQDKTIQIIQQSLKYIAENLNNQANNTKDITLQYQQELANQSKNTIDNLGGQLAIVINGATKKAEELITQVNITTNDMKNIVNEVYKNSQVNLEKLAEGSVNFKDGMDKMLDGAKEIHSVTTGLANVSENITELLTNSEELSESLVSSAESITQVSGEFSNILIDHGKSRDSIIEHTKIIQNLIEQAQNEVSIRGEVVQQVDAATKGLVVAQKESILFLDNIGEKLVEVNESFTRSITKIVGDANQDFYDQLSQSVKLLAGLIDDLNDTIDNFNPTK